MEETFLQAFSEIVRERIARKQDIEIEGLGRFQFDHRKQFQQQYENGKVVMMPPKDTINFIPDEKLNHEN